MPLKNITCHAFLTILLSASCLGFAAQAIAGRTPPGDPDTIIEKIKRRSEETHGQIGKLTYTADSLTTVTNAAGKIERTITSQRQIVFTPPDQIGADFKSMTIDGRALSAKEIAEELKKAKGRRGQSPFLPGEMPKYRFSVNEEKQYEDLPVWEVAFEPLEPGEGLAIGYAYIHQGTYDVVFMAFRPSQVPSVMKAMEAEMRYSPVEARWLPTSFKMNMHIKVSFIFTLADQLIDVEETFSNHHIQEIVK